LRWPLPLRVLLGVALGIAIGGSFGRDEIAFGWTTADLARLGGLYIRLLTALAMPLIFFAILDAFARTQITGRQGLKMLLVCGVNIAAAFAVGLLILNTWHPGRSWQALVAEQLSDSRAAEPQVASPAAGEKEAPNSLSLLEMLDSYVPEVALQPITVAALAILLGAAMRSLKGGGGDATVADAIATFERFAIACFQILVTTLSWLIEIAPLAICFVVAGVVGKTDDLGTLLERVGVYFATVMGALAVHALLYYPLSAWFVGGVRPRVYFGEGAAPILTGFSLNSSLATVPITLRALARMGVSDSSARLSACVGTNFNNDGITLYEAITALFIAQAAGMNLSLPQQAAILLVVLAASMGMAGIPNSGLIILPLVLRAAGLPEDVVNIALPIVLSIDFINARVRSAVNVMGDLQVAILLDAGAPPESLQPMAASAPQAEPACDPR
jgi:DAACS family dicarboxylate/amino acid:cation (Na+ or H+) symporter